MAMGESGHAEGTSPSLASGSEPQAGEEHGRLVSWVLLSLEASGQSIMPQAPESESNSKVKAFKRKLQEDHANVSACHHSCCDSVIVVIRVKMCQEETLRAGIIEPEGDGRAKRKAAALASEKLKTQTAMERGVVRKVPKAQMSGRHSLCM